MYRWFDEYTKQFIGSSDPEISGNTVLKINHSRRVLAVSELVGRSLKLSARDMDIARAAALLHDVGRFEQFALYKTLVDHKSVDHAAAGVKLLLEKKILDKFDKNKRGFIIKAVRYHNLMALPVHETVKTLLFAKLLRDADKIDILHILTGHFTKNNLPENEMIAISFPDKPRITPSVVRDLLNDRTITRKELRTLNDFKLMLVGWLTDLNFPKSVEIVRKRRYLDKLISVLPKKPEILAVYKHIKSKLN